jgi:beta-xylosidase
MMRTFLEKATLHKAGKLALLLALPVAAALLGAREVKAQEPAAAKATSGNPLFPGWYADPEVVVFGKEYWIYPTYSARYEEQTFLDAFSSKDLVTWTKHPRVVDNESIKWAKIAMWAPAIVQKDGKYFLFFAANDIQKEGEVGGIGVAVADSPAGPFKDYLGKPLLDKIVNRAQPIDQFVFKDKDGQYYMIYGGWGRCNITKLKSDFTGLEPFEDGSTFKEITPKGYVEGPFMFMRGGKYYFMWSEGGWGLPNYRVAYGIADSPMGPFERIDTVLQSDPEVGTSAGHHSVLQVPGTDDWYAVYHRRPIGDTARDHRVTCIDKMFFDEKGFIQPIKMTKEGVAPQEVK